MIHHIVVEEDQVVFVDPKLIDRGNPFRSFILQRKALASGYPANVSRKRTRSPCAGVVRVASHITL